jgi:ring-1,2-phenylacetyl-CoA epoxidase subunit PaaA
MMKEPTGNIIELPALPYSPQSVTRDMLDRMPEDYLRSLVRFMAMQAYAERMGATELGPWIKRAPTYRERRMLARILADEAHHSYLLYRELESIGVSESEAVAIAEGRTGEGAHSASLAGPLEVGSEQNEWIDIPLNNMFLDRAGRYMVANFGQSSYAPWARICQKIMTDEYIHEGFGYRELRRYLQNGYDREELARHVTHWFVLGLNFFGPPKSSKTERLRELGLKRRDNEELRQAYRAEVMKLLEALRATDLIRLRCNSFPYA